MQYRNCTKTFSATLVTVLAYINAKYITLTGQSFHQHQQRKGYFMLQSVVPLEESHWKRIFPVTQGTKSFKK